MKLHTAIIVRHKIQNKAGSGPDQALNVTCGKGCMDDGPPNPYNGVNTLHALPG